MKNFILLVCFVCGVVSSNLLLAQESTQNLPSPNPVASRLVEVNGEMVQVVNLQQPDITPPEPVVGASSDATANTTIAASASTGTEVSVASSSCGCQQSGFRGVANRTFGRARGLVSSVKCRVRHMLRRC
jgi:hypothetical protein